MPRYQPPTPRREHRRIALRHRFTPPGCRIIVHPELRRYAREVPRSSLAVVRECTQLVVHGERTGHVATAVLRGGEYRQRGRGATADGEERLRRRPRALPVSERRRGDLVSEVREEGVGIERQRARRPLERLRMLQRRLEDRQHPAHIRRQRVLLVQRLHACDPFGLAVPRPGDVEQVVPDAPLRRRCVQLHSTPERLPGARAVFPLEQQRRDPQRALRLRDVGRELHGLLGRRHRLAARQARGDQRVVAKYRVALGESRPRQPVLRIERQRALHARDPLDDGLAATREQRAALQVRLVRFDRARGALGAGPGAE